MYRMRDVARLAGVSVATVSAVVNHSAGVSAKRTQMVLEAMKALDYHPDQIARSLKMGKTCVIGMVIPDITNPFYPEVIRGAQDAARDEGYAVILCNSDEDPAQEQRNLDTLFSRRVDGVLVACSDSSTAYDRLIRRRFPIIFFDRIPKGFMGSAVSTDNLEAAYLATRHVIELGHTAIAMIAGNLNLSPHADRVEGFRKAMQESGLPIRDEYFCVGDSQVEGGRRLGLRLLSLPEPPTAILSSNNKMLLGLVRAIGELKVPCPERVSVVGFDDYAWTQHFSPRLTTVAQPSYEIGKRAMEMLLSRIRAPQEEKPGGNQSLLLKAELLIRESTAPPPGSSEQFRRASDHSPARGKQRRKTASLSR